MLRRNEEPELEKGVLMPKEAKAAGEYALGRNPHETERLQSQAGFIEPFTERLFRDAGIGIGMKVLDVGSGAGDVSLLAARIVGPQGILVGFDVDPNIVEYARSRVCALQQKNVTFHAGEIGDLSLDRDFDAVVGRYVLMFAADPVSVVRAAVDHLKPGGLVAFQEPDFTQGPYSEPPSLLLAQVWRWITEGFDRSGANTRMGLKLPLTFAQAGLSDLHLAADRFIGTGPGWGGYNHLAGLVKSLLPSLQAAGVTTPAEVDPDTLGDRLRTEIVSNDGVLVWQTAVRAWARKQ